MLERLPDNMRTPAVARAIMSPTGILLAGAGASVGILVGGGVIGAVALGAFAWTGKLVVTVLRKRPKVERIDPFTLQDPWRKMVMQAQSTGRRFDDAVTQTDPGPLHDRLATVSRRVDAGVEDAWRIAKRGHALDRAVAGLDLPGVRAQLAEAEKVDEDTADHAATVRAIRSQLQAAERLADVADDARSRLRRLNAELEEAVARAIELSLSAESAAAVQPLSSDVDTVVGELESLRLALEETDPGRAAGAI
ncbi:MAG: hypothetical protein ACRD12_20155 [Acidimicrobiales bacterium]